MKNVLKLLFSAYFVFAYFDIKVNAIESKCMGLFSDIDSTNIFCPYAEYLYHQGVLSGDKNDGYKFKSDDKLTRGQLAKIIKTAFQIPTNISGDDFPDVTKSHTFYTEIKSLKNANIVNGNSKGLFEPDSSVNRGAIMKFVLNGARYKTSTKIPSSNFDLTKVFPDVPSDHTFYNEIRTIYAFSQSVTNKDLQIISGYSDGKFYPGTNVTRGQTAKIITNAMKLTDSALVECSQTFCQDKFNGPIVPIKNVYNDANIKLTFPDNWLKSESLTKFLFAYEFNSGVQSIVGEKTSLNYVLELNSTRCNDLGKQIQSQLDSESSTFDEVNLVKTELLKISDNNVCKVELKNLRDKIQIFQNIYILAVNSNQVYQIVTTSGSGAPVSESIIKSMEITN